MDGTPMSPEHKAAAAAASAMTAEQYAYRVRMNAPHATPPAGVATAWADGMCQVDGVWVRDPKGVTNVR